MKYYKIPLNLLDDLEALNLQTGKYCVPVGDDAGNIIIIIPNDWTEHLQFAINNSLVISNYLIINSDELFCRQLIRKLFTELREAALTNTQRGTLLNQVSIGMNALAWGDAEVARAAFNSVSTTALWTQQRKDWTLLQIDNYLATL